MIESFKVLFSSEPVSALPPFGPTEGQKWFDHISNESPEEPVCINLFRQNPVFTSLHLKSPVHVHRLSSRMTSTDEHSYTGHRFFTVFRRIVQYNTGL